MGIGKKWEGGGGFWCVGIGEKWRWILGCGNRGKRGRVEVDFGVWERGRGRNRTHDLRSEARNEPTRLKVCAHRLILYKVTWAGEESNPRPSLPRRILKMVPERLDIIPKWLQTGHSH